MLGVCSRDQEREAGLAGAVGTQPGATLGAGLQWTAQNWYSAIPQPWITPWFLLRNKDISVLIGGQLAPCALLLWSLMVVDGRDLLTSHLVVPHQLPEKDLRALSPCPTLREVIGVGLQRLLSTWGSWSPAL